MGAALACCRTAAAGLASVTVGLLDRFRRKTVAGSRHAPIVHTEVLLEEAQWTQPFHWGLLIAHDNDADWAVPANVGKGCIAATPSCLAVPVRHSQDVKLYDDGDEETPLPQAEVKVVLTTRPLEVPADYDGPLKCPSGRLQVGDADEYRLVQVPAGHHRVQVWLEPAGRAERVVIALQHGG